LRALVTDLHIEGGDPAAAYVLNYETAQFTASNFFRIRLILRDITSGTEVAFWARQGPLDFTPELPNTVLFTQGPLPNYTGITVLARIDWSAIDWSRTVLTQYSAIDEAGVNPDRIVTRDEIMSSFARAAEPKVTLTVGAGTPSATHFSSFADAITSLYRGGLNITRSTFPCSDIAAFSNQVLIECTDNGYSEQMPATTIGGINQGILVPPFVTLRGRGDTRLFIPNNGFTAPVLEAPFSIRLEGLILENLSRGYALHIDNANGLSRRDQRDDTGLRFPVASIMKDCQFIGSTQQESWLIGCGISNGQLMVMDNCRNITAKQASMFGIHNSPGNTDPDRVEILNSTFNDNDFPNSAAVQLVKSFEQTVPHELVVRNSQFGAITNGSTIGGAPAFNVTRS
jgi:hypothetical protein